MLRSDRKEEAAHLDSGPERDLPAGIGNSPEVSAEVGSEKNKGGAAAGQKTPCPPGPAHRRRLN